MRYVVIGKNKATAKVRCYGVFESQKEADTAVIRLNGSLGTVVDFKVREVKDEVELGRILGEVKGSD